MNIDYQDPAPSLKKAHYAHPKAHPLPTGTPTCGTGRGKKLLDTDLAC